MAAADAIDSGVKTHLSPTAEELDAMFKSRYTQEDEEYMAVVNSPSAPPPCVDNWYSRPKRTYDWSRRGGRDDRRQHDRGHYRGHRGQGHRDYRDRSYDRDNRGFRNYGDRDQHHGGGGRPLYAGRRPEDY